MVVIKSLNWLLSHQGFRRYFHNTSWMFFERLMRIIAGLFVGIWVARYLGPEQFGVFSYVLAFFAIFGGIAKLGLDEIMVRELVKHPELHVQYLGTAFWLKVMGAVLVFVIIAIVVQYTSNDINTNIFIFIIASGLVFQSFEVIEFYFQSQVLAKFVSICKIIQLILSSLIKMYLVVTSSELMWFVVVALFDQMTLAISFFIAYRLKNQPIFYKKFKFSIAKKMLVDSWPLIFSSIAIMLYARIDQVMIKEFLGEFETGLYSASVRLTEAWLFVPVIIVASLFPAILNAKEVSQQLYEQRIKQLYTLISLIGILTAVFVTIFSKELIKFLFGINYMDGASVLSIRIWETVFAAIGVVSSKWLVVENLQKLGLYFLVIGAMINVILNYFLIPFYGIDGAAMASLLSIILTVIILPYSHPELRGNVIVRVKALCLFYIFDFMKIRK